MIRTVRGDDGREYIEITDVQIRVPDSPDLDVVVLCPPDGETFYPFDETGDLRNLADMGFVPVGYVSDDGPQGIRQTEQSTGPIDPVDIVDRIDELVNNQLANYSRRSGYDYNVNQEICPHCAREWHGLKITARMESMRIVGWYDEAYSYADDDTEVLCWGSDFIGPMRHSPVGNEQEHLRYMRYMMTWPDVAIPVSRLPFITGLTG